MSRARDIANYGDGIDTSSITSGTFADARIAQSNVTQHESAIDALGTVASGTFNGTIGSSAIITDGANPHGWEHIKTISYNTTTSGSKKMSNVVSSKYSAYKLFIQWGSDGNRNLFFRYLDSSDNEITAFNYKYGLQVIAETGAEGVTLDSTGNSDAQLSVNSSYGSEGFNGEITFFNCYASSSSFPQIDNYQLNSSLTSVAKPYAVYQYTGVRTGNYELGGHGFFKYNSGPTYVTGFQLTWTSLSNVQAGSWWSCYGLKLPTAD